MFRNFAFSPKDIIIVLLGGVIVYLLFFRGNARESTSIKQTETVSFDHIREIGHNDKLSLQLPEIVPAIVYRDSIVYVKDRKKLTPIELESVKDLKRYRDTTKFENGTVYSEILSGGTVYSNKVTADFKVKTITRTIEKETVRDRSFFFVSPEININPGIKFLNSAGASFNFISHSDFGAGLGINYNFNSQSVTYGIRLHKKLF